MKVRANKCRSLVILKGQVQRRELLLGGEIITPILYKPVKYLGKEYKVNLNEKEQIEKVQRNIKASLKKLYRCKLLGRYKSRIIQLLQKLMWPLTMYSIPLSNISELQMHITASLKKWLGIPKVSPIISCIQRPLG